MEKEKVIKWALVGLGKISRRMRKVIESVPNSTVVAAVSSSKERAKEYAKKYKIKHALTYSELEENPELVDAVYIATHMNAHTAPAVKYLSKKLPVLVEKTFALTVKDAEEMIGASISNGTLLMEGLWTRFLPATKKLQEILASGDVGKILSANSKFEVGIGHGPKSRVFNKNVGGGSLLDVGIYPTTYTHMLLGKPKEIKVKAKMKKGVDVRTETTFLYEDGVEAKFRVSVEPLTLSEFYTIECEKATIKVPSFFDARKIIVKFADGKKEVHKGFGRRGKPDGFSHEIIHFNQLIRDGTLESPVMTHKVTLEVMAMMEEQLTQMGYY